MLRRLIRFFSSTDWVLRFSDGEAIVAKGKLTRRFVAECEEALKSEGVTEAEIRGVRQGGHVALEFSDTIPPAMHQQFRNIRAMHDSD